MKLLKRALALLLCFLMLTNGPISAFATESVSDNDVVVETTTTTETEEVCEECGESDAHTETCSFNTINLMNNDAQVACTICGTVGCESTHEAWCDTCKKDSCGVDHTTPIVDTGSAINGEAAGCTECGATEGHSANCPQYKAPVETCEYCGIELTEGAVHLDTCLTLCTCEPVEGVHQEGCKLYVAPVAKCEHCGVELTEGAVHLDTCLTFCTCEPVEGVHQGECIFAPETEAEVCKTCGNQECTCPKVGDRIWIKSGSKVYKNYNNVDKNYRELIGNYEVEIKHILTNDDGVTEWYEFRFTDLGIGEIALSLGGYKYVHVENTSVEEPEDVVHDSSDTVTAEDGNTIQVNGIPENAELQIATAEAPDVEAISAHIGDTGAVETLFAYDITIVDANGEEWQPGDEPVTVTLTIPDLTLGFYQQLQVAHMHEGEVKMVENVEMDLEKETISFTTDGFSTFVGSFVDFSSTVQNSIMLTPGTAEPLEDILEAIDPEIYGDYTNGSFDKSKVSSVTVYPGDCGITVHPTSFAITASEDFGNTEATLTVNMADGTTYSIRVLRGEAVFGLVGAHDNWNSDPHSNETITIDGTDLGTYDVFNKVIYSSDTVKSLYNPKEGDVQFGGNYKVFLRPGMAFTFSDRIFLKNPKTEEVMGGWTLSDYKVSNYDFDGWNWIYNNDKHKNYLIAQKVDDYTVCRIEIRDADVNSTEVRYIELHIIPDNDPQLLRDYLGDRTDYTIKEVPATLFDYDGREWNKHYSAAGNTKYMAFHSADAGKSALTDEAGTAFAFAWTDSKNGVNSDGRNAKLGIMKQKLVDGLPVMAQGPGVDLFSTTSIGNAKKVYQNVGFEFIYDSDGYYNYNSELNHAQFNGKDKIELYTQSLSPSDSNTIGQNWADQNSKAGFYPFADIHEAFVSRDATGTEVDKKLDRLKNGVDDNNRLNGDLAKDFVVTSKEGSTVGMYFGLSITSDFYLPKDKKLNDNDMVYEFTGDDDLWVFIDGQLVLDIGGGHTPVSGSFNLTTGEVWVEYFSQLDEQHGGYYANNVTELKLDKVDLLSDEYFGTEEAFLQGLKGDQMHTISIFYMERYSGESNCRMRFNLPLVPSDAVNVSKKLVNQEGKELSVTPDVDYTFTLYTAGDDDDNIDATNFVPYANKSYTVLGTGAPTGTQTTDENGQFKLKDGWTASFLGIDRFTEVKVVESVINDGYQYAGHTLSINNGEANAYIPGSDSERKVMKLNQRITFDFVNKMQTQPLTVEKQVVNGTAGLIDPEQKFEFTLDFVPAILEKGEDAIKADNYVNLTDGGTFQLGHNESVTIPRVPVNMTFTLKEANPDTENGSFDAPKFESQICITTGTPNAFDTDYTWTMGDNGENKIVVTNQQRFDLTISKRGIQNAGHDNDEKQSTIYTIVGKIDDTVLVEMDVAICGNDSVTICKLPVGSYTVVENTDWSWRYDPVDGATRNVTIFQDAKETVTYNNNLTNQYWLSGDSYCENWWGGSNGTKVVKHNEKNEVLND